MTKIWVGAFWKPGPTGPPGTIPAPRVSATMLLPITALAALTLAIGLYAEPLVVIATRAANGLLQPTAYVRAVLGGVP